MNKNYLLFSFFIAFTIGLSAQSDRRKGQILLQVFDGQPIAGVVADLNRQAAFHFETGTEIASNWDIYRIYFAEDATNADAALQTVLRHPAVRVAQWNHLAEDRDRRIPNDSLWNKQVDMSTMNAPEAWTRTLGGLTAAGDTIVVAILEKGMRKAHPDLIPNLWHNWAEIPGNSIDDDHNGYIDDFTGWDANNGNGIGDGDGNGSSHGTSVTGIVGAKGDNTIGVTGVNWNIKMMTITNVIDESEIVAAYNYAGKARRLYNTTGGAQGAFVVATNASFGINNAMAADHAVWCAVYDSLGALGVLGIGATSNSSVDVDVTGDMPTTCTSEFLIAVNNVDANVDERVDATGIGSTSIDLGAPGQGSYTTINPTNSGGELVQYASFGGTSAACPHVTGTVGLLYSSPCTGFVADAMTQPATCARRVRDVIFNTVSPRQSLSGVTTTGGRVDVNAALEDVDELCTGVVGGLEIADLRPNPVAHDLQIRYQTPDYEQYDLYIYNMTGQLITHKPVQPDPFLPKVYTFDAQNLYPGMYIITFGRGKDRITKKFIKI